MPVTLATVPLHPSRLTQGQGLGIKLMSIKACSDAKICGNTEVASHGPVPAPPFRGHVSSPCCCCFVLHHIAQSPGVGAM